MLADTAFITYEENDIQNMIFYTQILNTEQKTSALFQLESQRACAAPREVTFEVLRYAGCEGDYVACDQKRRASTQRQAPIGQFKHLAASARDAVQQQIR
jgi:hypothetical protein